MDINRCFFPTFLGALNLFFKKKKNQDGQRARDGNDGIHEIKNTGQHLFNRYLPPAVAPVVVASVSFLFLIYCVLLHSLAGPTRLIMSRKPTLADSGTWLLQHRDKG